MKEDFKILLEDIKKCRHCADFFEHSPRPVVQLHPKSRILIVGQAPGRKVHESGVPWDDASGKRLRDWMGIEDKDFYNSEKIALLPAGFCYPGSSKNGDLPPRPECAPLWFPKVLPKLTEVRLKIVIGIYASAIMIPKRGKNLTETIRAFKNLPKDIIPLPHPSPRNIKWFKDNPWFEEEILPQLKKKVNQALL